MPSLVQWLHFSGARGVDGLPISSGTVSFFQPGSTSISVTAYSDKDGSSILTQPIALDAAGRAEVYLTAQAECVVKDALGSTVRLSGDCNSVAAEQVNVSWGGSPDTLAGALVSIATIINQAFPIVPAESLVATTISTQTPAFTFDDTKTLNIFYATYGGTSATGSIAWPSPAPTLTVGARYHIVIHANTGGGGTAITSLSFASNFRLSANPSPIVSTHTYSADFVALYSSSQLVQVTPWVDVVAP